MESVVNEKADISAIPTAAIGQPEREDKTEPEEYAAGDVAEFDQEEIDKDDEEDDEPRPEPKPPKGVERTEDDAWGTVSILTLDHPLMYSGKLIKKVKLHHPSGEEAKRMDRGKGDLEKAYYLISAVASIPFKAVCSLRLNDIERISEEIDFLKKA